MASVRAPDGREWKVGRRWLPGRPRLRRKRELHDPTWLEVFGAAFDSGFAIVAVVATVALVVLLIWPVIAVVLELLVFAVLVVATVVGRLAFRRPWQVVARTDDEDLAWEVTGWQASGRVIEHVKNALRSGEKRPRPPEAQRILAFRAR